MNNEPLSLKDMNGIQDYVFGSQEFFDRVVAMAEEFGIEPTRENLVKVVPVVNVVITATLDALDQMIGGIFPGEDSIYEQMVDLTIEKFQEEQ